MDGLALGDVVFNLAEEHSGVPAEAVLVAAGAVVAALITVFAAHRRQRNVLNAEHARLELQLEAEELRLEKQLEAEQRRLETQQIGERVLHDLDELRARIDAAIDKGEQMLASVITAYASWETGEIEDAQSERSKAVGEFMELSSFIRRVMLRLGRQDYFVELLEKYKDGLGEADDIVAEALGRDKDATLAKKWDDVIDRAASAQANVIDAATTMFGSALEREPSG